MTSPGEAAGLPVEVRRGSPTEAELAALIAVVTESYVGEAAAAEAEDSPGTTAWAVSARSLRQPLRRELGWAGFRP